MLITCHWSASSPAYVNAYHLEFGATKPLPQSLIDECYNGLIYGQINLDLVNDVRSNFQFDKFVQFGEPTLYGTWHQNHDLRDGSANIEIAALCMGGEGVSIAGPWGPYPYTAAHAVMHAALAARVCAIKNLQPTETFETVVRPDVLQNGPISVLSTHGERAIQTYDAPGPDGAANETSARRFGYFAYSGDPDLRYDLAALDIRDAPKLGRAESARASCLQSAHRLRALTQWLMADDLSDMWGLG